MAAQQARGSTLLLEEYYEAGDDRFLAELLRCRSEGKLKALVSRWYDDPRPWARTVLLRYIDDGCDRPNHRVLVKGLFKRAEAKGDDEALAHFMVAFDRLNRRRLVEQKRYDWSTRKTYSEFVLKPDKSVPSRVPKEKTSQGRNPRTGERIEIPVRSKSIERFSRHTRRYLCRRVLRYFRRLGFRDVERYGRTIRAALVLYSDEHLQKSEQLLESWSLVHALYWGSPVIKRSPHGIKLAEGATLGSIVPAPLHPAAWQGVFDEVLALVEHAQSRTVRVFALALLTREYASELRALPSARWRALLRSPHEEIQQFAVERLRSATDLANLPVGEWLTLLSIESVTILPVLCELFEASVHPDRLSLQQCVDLASSPTAPVAELGLRWAREKPVETEDDLRRLLPLCEARAPRVRAEAARWVEELLLASPHTRPQDARDLMDAKRVEARQVGLALLEARFPQDAALWAAASETPYDDVRARLVAKLGEWERLLDRTAIKRIWATTLLAIHRGGRAKRTVVRQVAEHIVQNPEQGEALLPLLGYALRSVRVPERRAGLAALAQAAYRTPSLRATITRHLPELRLFDEAVS
jgi:hypothetical protein